ncbi:flavin-containing monooxygenase [Streptomyces antibioticus]|uniref:flavin-containing monooxygenase n=1 Tax=Streptomyces antibioticus TaxID=1890 RepID=UPI0033BA19D3
MEDSAPPAPGNGPTPAPTATTGAAPAANPADRPVYVVGGGPGGLAVAHALRARGIRAVVVEKAEVGASWSRHYDRLRLHTTRRTSALPGLKMPRRFGRWAKRDDVVRYLEKYAEVHELEIITGVEVSRIERSADGTGWLLHGTGGRELTGAAVVVATGYNHTPHLPDWPGRETYDGDLVHAAAYRDGTPYAGRDVLVVGVGNTGAEIAVDLVEHGASRVRLAVRTVPHIVRRSTAGWPAQYSGILVRRLPVGLVDRICRVMALTLPDLSAQGLPRPDSGLYTRAREGAIPVQDVGLLDGVRKGRIEVVAAVDAFEEGGKVLLADGTRISPDAVVAATGYVRALEPLVGHLGVLDERGLPLAHGPQAPKDAPGLYFTGFTTPISGTLRELGIDAERIAKAVRRQFR